MAFKATLTLNGKDYDLVDVSIIFSQETGKNGKPTSVVKGGTITMRLIPTADVTFAEWMMSDTKTMHGEFRFYSPEDSEKVIRKIKFTKAFCTGYEQVFGLDGKSGVVLQEKVSLSAEKVDIGDVEHDNKWPK